MAAALGLPARTGLSLLQLLAALSIVAVVTAVAVPRFSGQATAARRAACHTHRGEIELQAQLWYRNHGAWPAGNLADIAADASYFPEGLPACPAGGGAYSFDPASQRVIGHSH